METVILGISISTRMEGLAVFKSRHLMDYSLKLHKDRFSPKKKELILSSLQSSSTTYTINHIALSMPLLHYQTDEFKAMVEVIETFAESKTRGFKTYVVQTQTALQYQKIVRANWLSKPDKNPHRMAHYGYVAFRPKSSLSFFDFGMESFTGQSI